MMPLGSPSQAQSDIGPLKWSTQDTGLYPVGSGHTDNHSVFQLPSALERTLLCKYILKPQSMYVALSWESRDLLLDLPSSVKKGKRHKGLGCPSFNGTRQKGRFCTVAKGLISTDKHLKSLDSYLAKQNSMKNPNQIESLYQRELLKTNNGLRSLENCLDKVKDDSESEIYIDHESKAEGKEKSADEASDFYLIGILVSINIAVFLFEIAAPVKNSDFELFSLPMVYGAKINNLILTGEWWRLLTPIFLHSGIFHIALGIWVLFTFGLEVSREYGSFTFLLIYILGGISGNLISFLHTPEPTVGGTGPVFAIIGAWLIYQVQNKDVIARDDASERLFQNAIITTALSFVLSSFGPIDDWAHFAAAFTGIAYGFVTCPSLQLKDASSEAGRQERMTLVRRYADPCKSLTYFSIFLLLLSSLLFVVEPPLDLIE
ncbi:rhomboid protease glup [Phtheirospermum japonicum]|uniref:Rhomboid protease glup n=1 Tax=Phtheirospermum japonicum TaxID=374723 RepID=A0A830BH28_9LAMI|nr:rhomboid protease glup [Phtheirospermum japonicum]